MIRAILTPARIALALLLSTAFANAAVWTVDPDPATGADFTDLQQAIDVADAGDTLHVAGASEPYGPGIQLNKPLSLYGPGYFLVENGVATGSNALAARIWDLNIDSGADGALVSGFVVEQQFRITQVSSVYVRGNRIEGGLDCDNVGYAVFAGNYFSRPYGQIQIFDCPTVRFANNIAVFGAQFSYESSEPLAGHSLEFHHNLFEGLFSVGPYTAIDIEYTIFFNSNFDLNGIVPTSDYNVDVDSGPIDFFGTNDLAGVPYGNVFDASAGDLFNPPTVDADFQLPVSSIARDVLGTGVDAGPFGGTEPYRLSGLPNIPRITELTAPNFTTTSDGLNIELSIESGPEAP